MTTSIKEFFLNSGDLSFIFDQVSFPTIKVVGYTADGKPAYGLSAAGIPSGVTSVKVAGHTVNLTHSGLDNSLVISIAAIFDASGLPPIDGTQGSFDPLNSVFSQISYDDASGTHLLPSYTSARDYQGLRNVTGEFNNLIDGQTTWGAANEQFVRLVDPDYSHYSKEDIGAGAPINSATDFQDANTKILSQTTHIDGTTTVLGAIFPVTTWTETVTRTGTSIHLDSLGHHTTVNHGTETVTTTTGEIESWVQIGGVSSYSIADPGTTAIATDNNYISGGELDTTTLIDFGPGFGLQAAHDFHGVTNGVTSPADYSNPLANVVDYTPRMISQTVTSSTALERLNADNPGLITDSTDTIDANGNIVQQQRWDFVTDPNTGKTTLQLVNYTENFIQNTNSYDADPSYSGWFVLFGQFFDHGLDFIQKPGGGPTIQIALAVDDPLYGKIGPDGKPTTSITISRATPTIVNGVAQYQNTDSPYIDQNQTYGATEQITLLLRQWVADPNNPGHYVPSASLLDGHSVQQDYLSTVFADQGSFNADGEGLTNRTIPTLNELRVALAATGRDDLTWEDISNYRIRDASGHVLDSDGNAANGTQAINSGQAVILDMNPRFDSAHLSGQKFTDALAALNSSLGPVGSLDLASGGAHDGELHLHINIGFPGAGDYYGAQAMAPWVDFATNNIVTHLFNDNDPAHGMPAISDAVHAAAGEVLLESIGDHYVAGDGRANENFGLTTVHHVFHEDHNVQLVNLESNILQGQDSDPVKAHNWQVKVFSTGQPVGPASGDVSTADAAYTGANYHYDNLHTVTDASGTYFVADITGIRDARGNIITTDGQDYNGSNAVTAHNVYVDASGHVSWNQDMMFNAAKLIVEMEYQHVAIDQYARFVTPDLPEFVTYDANINADISLEYAQAAFRFGHSQLRDTIDAIETQGSDHSFDITGAITHYALGAAFLNPAEFASVGPGAIALGMTQQVGNETDEFVTPALQQDLLGQPLDLAAINIARGRDIGLPTLNETRKQLYNAIVAERANTNGPGAEAHAKIQLDLLKPYNSWNEFAGSMIHPESLVDFIAAYSFDGDLQKAKAVIGLDDSSMSLAEADAVLGNGFTAQMAHDFMSGSLNPDGTFKVDGAGGFNNIDLWLGGLAESHVLGGILGPTFNAIFEDQMERLMDGDRFYYLYRLFGALPNITNLNEFITNEQFKDIVERTTGVKNLNGDIMLYADSYVETGYKADLPANATLTNKAGTITYYTDASGKLYSDAAHTTLVSALPANDTALFKDGIFTGAGQHKYGQLADDLHLGVHSATGSTTDGNGQLITIADPEHAGQFLTFINDARPDSPIINSNNNPTYGYDSHEVLSGTDYNDYLDTGDGDDTAYGGKGNDILVGNGGSDHLYGGDGNDIVYGAGGTAGADVADFLDGGDGDDYIYGGQNAGATEVLIGGKGNDHIYGESGIDELYGGEGNDFIDCGGDTDLAFGDAGNDEMYGGEGPDELHGGQGDDLISGGSGTDKLIGEEGDDILFGGQGGGVAQGDSDELIGGDQNGVDTGFDLANYSDSSIKLDVAADLNNQQLQGTIGTNGATSTPFEPFNHFYYGIDGLVGSKFDDQAGPTAATTENPRGNPFGAGLVGDDNANWLIGGSGNDIMQGQGGNDVVVGGSIKLADLNSFMGKVGFAQHFTDLQNSRPGFVLGDDGTNAHKGSDEATFVGNLRDYKLEALDANGNVIATAVTGNNNVTTITQGAGFDITNIYAVRVIDNVGTRTLADGVTTIPGDGTDILIGVDKAQFANTLIGNLTGVFDIAPALDLHYVAQTTNQSVASDSFTGFGGNAYNRGSGWASAWIESADDVGGSPSSGQIQVVNNALRLDGGDGTSIQRAIDLSGKTSATVSFTANESNFGANETVKVYFAADGTNFVLEKTFDQNTNNAGTQSFTVVAPVGGFSSNALLKFEVSNVTTPANPAHTVTIDNITVTSPVVTDQFPGNNYSTDYTERAAGVAIASTPLISDPDGATIASATVHIRETVTGDVLTVGNLTGTGITATGSGTGTITLTGVASHAVYQSVLAGITFSNPTNHNPTNGAPTALLHVDVTVNDGYKDSNLATTSVTVHAVDEAPTLGSDTVITNIGTGTTAAANILIPDAALLANDTDPDTNLTVTGVSNGVGLTIAGTGLGHATNPAGVTVRDGTPAGGSFQYQAGGSSTTVNVTQQSGTTLTGTNNSEIMVGGSGNDTINAGDGNDFAVWNVSGTTQGGGTITSGGHDFIDGGAGTDTFVLDSAVTGNGPNSPANEAFRIYTAAAWTALGGTGNNGHTVAAGTEIVITRNGTANSSVVAELKNIEELVMNGGPGNDTFTIIGNFDPTHLKTSTITINDADGGDTVDITGLTSTHRIVFHTDANGHVIGTLRPQDQVYHDGVLVPPPSNDTNDNVTGTQHDDDIDCGKGNDEANGKDGNDKFITRDGDGNDTYVGGKGHDTYDASQLTCSVTIDLGHHHAHSQDGGDDDLQSIENACGGKKNDIIRGDEQANALFGCNGNDRIYGYGGADRLDGGTGNDVLFGDRGDDFLYGGDGNDKLYGQAGKDVLTGGKGDDFLAGGTGIDTFIFRPGFAHETVGDFHLGSGASHDVLDLRGTGISDISELLHHTTTSHGNAVIHIDTADSVTLLHITKTQLANLATSHDFIF